MNAAASNISISRLGQVAVNVRSVERATAFYRDTLALPFLFAAGGMAFFDCGGVRLMLARGEQPEHQHPSSVLYFAVPDINAAHRRLSEIGVRFEGIPHLVAPMPDHDLWIGFFRDSEDNLMALMSEVPHAK